MDRTELTPVERRGLYWFKRDDLYQVSGVCGGKARTCWHLAQDAPGLVTAGSRASPQVNIVAHIAADLGIPCRVHVPSGALSPELLSARAEGAEIIQHTPGYNTVIIARARADAQEHGWTHIPFGMECTAAVEETALQTANLPDGPRGPKRVVVPVGSGMSLAGILLGLRTLGRRDLPVLGVRVGADPVRRLDRYAPGWRGWVTLIEVGGDYHSRSPKTAFAGVRLDSIYESKCIPFLKPGDLLWVVGIRLTETEVKQGIVVCR